MVAVDHVAVAGDGNEDVANLAAAAIGITRNPSITASTALIGSISVTTTFEPMPRAASHAFAAPSVTDNYQSAAGQQNISGADDASSVDCPVP